MANIGSRKQITFDLCQEALKKYYPHSLTQAYYDIRRFMESHGFEHRQSSAYVSLDKMTTLGCGKSGRAAGNGAPLAEPMCQ